MAQHMPCQWTASVARAPLAELKFVPRSKVIVQQCGPIPKRFSMGHVSCWNAGAWGTLACKSVAVSLLMLMSSHDLTSNAGMHLICHKCLQARYSTIRTMHMFVHTHSTDEFVSKGGHI